MSHPCCRLRFCTAWIALLLLTSGPAVLRADEAADPIGDALDGLSGKEALALVGELAADDMLGRKTGFKGGELVERWFAMKMADFGVQPADAAGSYLEPFTYGATNVAPPIACRLGDASLEYGKAYFDLIYSGSGQVAGEVVFCGFGIHRPDLGWDDYAGVDVKGKVVLAIRGAPKARAGEFQEERMIGYKSSTAADQGAIGFLLVEDAEAHTGTIQERFHRPALPSLWIAGSAADRLLAGTKKKVADLKAARDGGAPGQSFATGTRAALEVHSTFVPRAQGHNALASLPGRDVDLVEEIILIGAHMDHLGVDAAGRVYNGADDNASGTAVVVHLADVLSRNKWRPKRTVIFCGFGAEEQGLVGSDALAKRYPFNGKIVCVLTLDMVGQGQPVLTIGGCAAYPAMTARLRSWIPKDLRSSVEFGPRCGPNSDHWPFYSRGVPAYFSHTKGKHPNYHNPKDDAANISADCLGTAARVMGTLLVRLGNHTEPLYDPLALPAYLLREGPRFARASLGDVAVPEAAAALLESGITALLVDVSAGADAAAAMKTLRDVAGVEEPPAAPPKKGKAAPAPKKDAPAARPWLLARGAVQVDAAFRQGRVALVPCLAWGPALLRAPAGVGALAKLGYHVHAPFGAVPGDFSESQRNAVLDACVQARVLVDLTGLTGAALLAARKRLGERNAIFRLPPSARPDGTAVVLPEGHDALGAHTLLLLEGVGGDAANLLARSLAAGKDASSAVVLSRATSELVKALAAWGVQRQAVWAEPKHADRRAVRAALGGRLVEWLRPHRK